jgi:aspartokinase-like uncharacterized kinase
VSDLPPLVVKIGGGLLRDQGLAGLRRACTEVDELAARRQVLVVPGGGPFADAVRAVDAQLGLADDIAHGLALRAMDQLGMLLTPLLPGAELLDQLVAPRGLGLVLAAVAFSRRPEIPASWDVTSDSLAVLAAGAIGAEEALLLKPEGGVPAFSRLTANELRALQDAGEGRFVDAYLPDAVCRTGVSVSVRTPGGGSGTRITPR